VKGELTGKNCVKCGAQTVWKTCRARPTGFSPVCLDCKKAWATSARGRASRRGANRNYRKTEAGKRTDSNSNSRRRARKLLAECQTCHGSKYYDIRQGAYCYVCGAPAEATDHVFPLAKKGLHCNDNFAPICTDCNSIKLDRIWPGHPDWNQFVSDQKKKLTNKL
jgi:hypothetical protein